MSLTRLVSSFLLGSFLALGCAGTDSIGDGEQSQDLSSEISLPFEEIDVRKSNAPSGLTIIRKKADFKSFFGQDPPPTLNFNASWVIHYSMGIQNTGGYDANILQVERNGSGSSAHLFIKSQDVTPGPNCKVTMAFTNPQVTVKIPKQSTSITVDHEFSLQVTDCGTIQNWCATALCGPGMGCDEFQDACVPAPFCPLAKCAKGFVCSEEERNCVPAPCDPDEKASCPEGFVCENNIVCVTTPCPADYRCQPAPADPCESIGWVGTCEGTLLKYCIDSELYTVECAPGECGYSSSYDYYDCL
jgi:hypothetical protein